MSFENLKPGDELKRVMSGVESTVIVKELTENRIICELGYVFDRDTGYEVEDRLPPEVADLGIVLSWIEE